MESQRPVRAGVNDGIQRGVRAGVNDGIQRGVRAGVNDGIQRGVRAGVKLRRKQVWCKSTFIARRCFTPTYDGHAARRIWLAFFQNGIQEVSPASGIRLLEGRRLLRHNLRVWPTLYV